MLELKNADSEKGEKRTEEIELQNQESTRRLEEKENYKNLEILKADTFSKQK